jgi:glycosyltransferase involved in cell wall biosynthesis
LNIDPNLIKDIKVSVIIPLFNHREYIIDCINNIINQTHKNLEIIIVDDCSTDDSYDLVNDFIMSNNNNNNIKLLKTEKNSGCYHARNIGILNSIGDYIAFQDSDDLSLSSRIEEILYNMIISNKKIGFSNIYRIKYFDIPSDIVSNDQQLIDLCEQDKNESQMITYDLGIVTSIIDRKLFDKYGLYNDKMRHSSDLEFIERVYCIELNVNPYDIHHMHSFIKEGSNDLIYYNGNNNNINYICRKMNTNNNTFIYKEKERKNYMNEWKKNIYNQMAFP